MKTEVDVMKLAFHFDPTAHYECTSCGKCCRSEFEIPIQPGKAEAIKSTERFRQLSKEGYQPLRVLGEDFHFLAYDAEGRCHFLEEEYCGLHCDEGPHSKPVVCQLYPFNLIGTPDGIFVSLLYTCPAVLAGNGGPIPTQESWLKQLFEAEKGRVPQLPSVKEHVLITQYQSMSWNEYLELEQKFLTKVSEEDPIQSLLDFAASLISEDAKPLLVSSLREEQLPLFATSLLTYLEDQLETEEEAEDFLNALREGTRPHSHRLNRELEPFQLLKPPNAFVREAVHRYITNQIRGKLLLLGPSLVGRLLFLCVGLGILFYDLQARHFDFDELEKAFDVCEGKLLSQSNEFEEAMCELEDEMINLCY